MKKPDQYWDRPWSLVDGCSPCSPGCDHCWSAEITHRFRRAACLTAEDGKYNGRVEFRHDRLDLPARVKKPVVYALWTDLFHPSVSQECIEYAWEVMRKCPRHTFLILTKRAHNMMKMIYNTPPLKVLSNVWLGVTVCSTAEADVKLSHLIDTPAAHRFVSVEPMIDHVDIGFYLRTGAINFVICGPENGKGKRPFSPTWAARLYADCKDNKVPFFYKGGDQRQPVRELPWAVKF